MRSFRLVPLSAACLWLSAGPLFLQPDEEIGPLPFQLGAAQSALLETLKPTITELLVLPEGTPVALEFLTLVTTRTAKHRDQVSLQVASDVSVESLTVIPKGSMAWGNVTLAKKPGHFSRNGKLRIALESVTLLNGQTIAIHNRPLARKQAGGWDLHQPDSLQAPLLVPFALAILAVSPDAQQAVADSIVKGILAKGHQVELVPGTRIEAVISQAVDLEREEFSKLQPPLGTSPEGR